MTTKIKLKSQVKKLKKRIKRMRKIVKIGLKTIKERDGKIGQLTSVLEHENKPSVNEISRKR